MPNLFAYAMLFIWPLIMIVLFKRMTPDRALIWSFLGAFMFLPSGVRIDLPLVPVLDKFSIPSLAALVLCLTMLEQKIRILPASKVASIFMIGFMLSPFAAALSNREPVIYGVVFMPGQSMQDAISAAMGYAITLIPFILAFNLLSTRQARRNFLIAYMTAGLIYSIPMLLEIRLAPQFSYWVYGYFVELFGQQLRFGGYRPVVFMGHGLTVAFFLMITALSTAILWRVSQSSTRTLYSYAAVYLLIVLVLCKTVGPLIFAALFLPVILFTGQRIKSWAIMVCALFVLTYPVLRSADIIPTEELVGYAAMIQDERARSLDFRFNNEEMLLDHAARKPMFGWGFWDRNRLFDPESGRELVITDGYWIIVIGILGWTGYICIFGLLTLPLIKLWWQRNSVAITGDIHLIYGTALLLSINLLELIPNSTINTMTWLLAGLLLAASLQSETADDEEPATSHANNAGTPPLHIRKPRGERFDSNAPSAQFKRKRRDAGRGAR